MTKIKITDIYWRYMRETGTQHTLDRQRQFFAGCLSLLTLDTSGAPTEDAGADIYEGIKKQLCQYFLDEPTKLN